MQRLAEAAPGEMFGQLPPVQLVPHEMQHSTSAADYIADVNAYVSNSGSTSTTTAGALQSTAAGPSPAGCHCYACPVYRTATRTGMLNNMGHSTNFLMHISLPLPACSMPQHWLLRGVAAVCSVND